MHYDLNIWSKIPPAPRLIRISQHWCVHIKLFPCKFPAIVALSHTRVRQSSLCRCHDNIWLQSNTPSFSSATWFTFYYHCNHRLPIHRQFQLISPTPLLISNYVSVVTQSDTNDIIKFRGKILHSFSRSLNRSII